MSQGQAERQHGGPSLAVQHVSARDHCGEDAPELEGQTVGSPPESHSGLYVQGEDRQLQRLQHGSAQVPLFLQHPAAAAAEVGLLVQDPRLAARAPICEAPHVPRGLGGQPEGGAHEAR